MRTTRAQILVAEDHEVNWMLIERMLARRGHGADNARDGHQTLAMLAHGGYQLILMDCRMPRLDGYETTREIRRREAAEAAEAAAHGSHVAIVAMSANATEDDRRRCLAAGMDDYIVKPLSFEILDHTLARWLSPVADDHPALDEARLDQLSRALSREEVCGMLRKLSAEVGGEVERIRLAGAQADRGALADTAHRIQNSARLIGASALADAAARVEARAERDRLAPWRPDEDELLGLSREWELTLAAIERAI